MACISALPLIMLFSLLCFAFFSVQGCRPHELKTLLTFKSTVNDTAKKLKSWKGEDCCVWKGVRCSATPEGGHVSKLDLRDFQLRSLRGEIDSSVFRLEHLDYLDVRGNYFHGEIPSQLGMLSSLRHLYLDSDDSNCMSISDFSSCIDNILTSSDLHWLSNLSSLEYLSLSVVAVKDKGWGNIIGSLLHLKHLDLSGCSLSAPTIPNILLNLSSLAFLNLSRNSFSNIPTWMGELSSLTHLDIWGNNMAGSIPNSIGNLTGLKYFDLSFNALTGQIPVSLGHNRHLFVIALDSNKLEGTIPSSFGLLLNLTFLGLGYNQLKGNVPASLGNLRLLTKLYLSSNQLSGSLPASLGNLRSLKQLYLSSNQLSGSLPVSFGHMYSLTDLDVGDNHLNGSISSGLMLPSSLRSLYLSNNMMNGTLTEVFFQKHLKLESLDLSHSGFSINISSTWIPFFQLSTLGLKNCQIGGPIPSWISTQFSLSSLDLSTNQLMGDLPSWLWDIDEVVLSDNHLQGSFTPTSGSLRYLDLSMNELSGRLPADIHVQLSKAEVLILADNKFGGQIPTSIANLKNLSVLDMSNNRLTGNVPAFLGNLTHLQALSLENNCLEGEIPRELGSLSYLQSLRIGKNSLQGILPSSLRNLSRLEVLDVGGNSLTRNMPHWIANFSNLHVLQMRNSNFRGNLPPEIGGMPKLQVLDLSHNYFSGAIPHSYLRLQALQNSSADGRRLHTLAIPGQRFAYIDESIDLTVKGMERHYEYVLSRLASIDLSNNRLSGPLPPEVENLKGLMHLNLSRNSLSGPIPQSLGNLVQLESLDLSFNKFSGRIPSEIGNLTFLAHLNLTYNNLFGRIPHEQAQMVTFDAWSYIGNPNLWGCPLERNCSRPKASLPPALSVKKGEEGLEFPWYWMWFGLSTGLGFSTVMAVLILKLTWRAKCFEAMDRVIEMMNKVICMLFKLKPMSR